jgi:hypothetical protein
MALEAGLTREKLSFAARKGEAIATFGKLALVVSHPCRRQRNGENDTGTGLGQDAKDQLGAREENSGGLSYTFPAPFSFPYLL